MRWEQHLVVERSLLQRDKEGFIIMLQGMKKNVCIIFPVKLENWCYYVAVSINGGFMNGSTHDSCQHIVAVP